MATAGLNEADTRSKLIDPLLYSAQWVERVAPEQQATHGQIHREQTAQRIDILDGKPLQRGKGRVDYLLRAHVVGHEHPLTLAFVEAKRERLPPTHGMEQAKGYARRHTVPFVYSTNGHLFVEYDDTTGLSTPPRPLTEFPSPASLRQRWLAAKGMTEDTPALAPLLTPYNALGRRPRYYQDAAIRAVLERIAQASAKAQAIEDAVYDIKAQNPNEQKVVDSCTPAQLLQAIHDKGLEVDAALRALRALVGPVVDSASESGDAANVHAIARQL